MAAKARRCTRVIHPDPITPKRTGSKEGIDVLPDLEDSFDDVVDVLLRAEEQRVMKPNGALVREARRVRAGDMLRSQRVTVAVADRGIVGCAQREELFDAIGDRRVE